MHVLDAMHQPLCIHLCCPAKTYLICCHPGLHINPWLHLNQRLDLHGLYLLIGDICILTWTKNSSKDIFRFYTRNYQIQCSPDQWLLGFVLHVRLVHKNIPHILKLHKQKSMQDCRAIQKYPMYTYTCFAVLLTRKRCLVSSIWTLGDLFLILAYKNGICIQTYHVLEPQWKKFNLSQTRNQIALRIAIYTRFRCIFSLMDLFSGWVFTISGWFFVLVSWCNECKEQRQP